LKDLDEVRRDALDLIEALWDSVSWKRFPGRLRLRVYSVFQDWIQDAAYTSSLHKFIANFVENADAEALPGYAAERLNQILSGKRDREILRVLREETPALIVMLRARRGVRETSREGDKNV